MHCQAGSLTLAPPGKPINEVYSLIFNSLTLNIMLSISSVHKGIQKAEPHTLNPSDP